MYEQTQSLLTEAEKLLIADELEKLFTLQDRPFSAKKSAAFIEEFEKSGLPVGAIIAGIRSLMYVENIGTLDFPKIAAACRSKVTQETQEKADCEHCDKRGLVMMRDPNAYEFAFACICSNSSRYPGHQKWNGENTQYHREQIFTKRFAA